MRWLLALSLALSFGCARRTTGCGPKVLTLWPNAAHAYTFQTIELTTLQDITKLEGPAARIYLGNRLTAQGYQGSPAEPNFTSANGVCVATDATSAAAVNAYAQFESLYKFERALGTEAQVTWPRSVGIELKINGRDADALNNAHYFGEPDAIGLVPYTRGGLPMSFNQGIIAHEHFHAHFMAQVIRPMNAVLDGELSKLSLDELFGPLAPARLNVEDTTGLDPASIAGFNNFVLRGWNEGLADFFGSTYTNSPDVFMPSQDVPERRLNQPLARESFAAALSANIRSHAEGKVRTDQMMSFAYGIGALLARELYRIAHRPGESPERVLQFLMGRLHALGPAFVPRYTSRRLEPNEIFGRLLEGYPRSTALCRELRFVMGFSPDLFQKDFAECAQYSL